MIWAIHTPQRRTRYVAGEKAIIMRSTKLFIPIIAIVALQGCVAKTLYDVATLPVKVVGKGVDLATTSQSEADQKRGQEIRRREERLGELQREFDKLDRKCADGTESACRERDKIGTEIVRILPTVPTERARPD